MTRSNSYAPTGLGEGRRMGARACRDQWLAPWATFLRPYGAGEDGGEGVGGGRPETHGSRHGLHCFAPPGLWRLAPRRSSGLGRRAYAFPMKYRRLGSTGLRVSVIGLGTWQFGGEWGKEFSQDEVDRMLERA